MPDTGTALTLPAVGGRTPPYIAFKTLLTFFEELRTNGLPPQIDRSVLKRFSGAVGSQLIMALKSLGLTDDSNRPSESLQRIVATTDPDGVKSELHQVILKSYPFLAGVDLKAATPTMFADAFKKNVTAKDDVLRKCRTFYLHAAQFAGVEIGSRLLNGSFPRTASGTTAVRKKPRAKVVTEASASMPSGNNVGTSFAPPSILNPRDPVAVLVSIIDMGAMDEIEQEAVWTLIRYLKKREAATMKVKGDA